MRRASTFLMVVATLACGPGAGAEQELARERERAQEQEPERAQEHEQEPERAQEHERELDRERERGIGLGPARTFELAGPSAHELPAGAPGLVVRVPEGVANDDGLWLVVFLHGHSGCARVLEGEGPTACRPGEREREGWRLGARHDEAHTGSVFLVPQLAWLRRSGNPGRLREPDFFGAQLAAVVAELTAPGGTAPELRRVTLVAHSGGFEAALAILRRSHQEVDDVVLMDALYSGGRGFFDWAQRGPERRLVSLVTGGGETARNNRAVERLCETADIEVGAFDDPAGLVAAIEGHRVTLGRVRARHAEVPAHALADVLRGLRAAGARQLGSSVAQ